MSSFTGLNNIEALSGILAGEVQALETAARQVLEDVTDFDNSVGAQLDIIGAIVGLSRQGLSDAIYRDRLKVQRLVNRSAGHASEIIQIVNLFASSPTFAYEVEDNHFPAGFNVEITSALPAGIGEQLAIVVRSVRGAGINGYVTFHEQAPIFAFDGAGGAQFDTGGYLFRTAIG